MLLAWTAKFPCWKPEFKKRAFIIINFFVPRFYPRGRGYTDTTPTPKLILGKIFIITTYEIFKGGYLTMDPSLMSSDAILFGIMFPFFAVALILFVHK